MVKLESNYNCEEMENGKGSLRTFFLIMERIKGNGREKTHIKLQH